MRILQHFMDKFELLKNKIVSYGKLCVAYSGGVDSSFLLHIAHQLLDENAMAILIDSPVLARRDFDEALKLLKSIGVKYEIITSSPFTIPGFTENGTMRCYFCKRNYFSQVIDVAEKNGISIVVDGQNADDVLNDYRPGIKASKELRIVSPLAECMFTKDEIRQFSKRFDIPTWNKPSNACLASRFPYGFEITPERLATIELAEEVLRKRGIEGCRVRWHDNIARIEAERKYFDIILNNKSIVDELKTLGFKYVTLDLEGFRSGSMN